MLFVTENIRSVTSMGRQCSLFFIFAALVLQITGADIIGVHLEEESQDGPPTSKKTEEDVVGLYDPVLKLNRFSFQKTLFEEHGNEVAHWIVLFCPAWYEPCQALQPIYRRLSEQWQGQLNNALLSTEVRFASVDCATEKALCNTQDVGMHYPFVAHYRDHKKVAQWRGKSFETDEQRIRDWLRKELGHISMATKIDSESEAKSTESQFPIPLDFLLIFAAIAGNAWFISRGLGGEASPDARSPSKAVRPESRASHAAQAAETRDGCVQRSLPKEWAQERPSLEL